MNYNKREEVLQDVNKSKNKAKVIDWKGYKLKNLELSKIYYELYGNLNTKAERCKFCGSELIFKKSNENLKLHSANFCKIRLCPMCSWRRSLKIYGQVSKVVDCLEKSKEYNYLFLTLTIKNCKEVDLKNNIDIMFKGFKRMSERKQFKDNIKGFFRTLEVTYNINNDTYHPHFHIILVVNKRYFKNNYISQDEWTKLWKSCLKIDYTPIVDIRKIKKVDYKAIAEVSKYSVKSKDFLIRDELGNLDLNKSKLVVDTLDKSLAYRRLTTYGGIMKDVHKKLNLDDVEDGNLINTDNDEEMREDIFEIVKYIWSNEHKNYILSNIE